MTKLQPFASLNPETLSLPTRLGLSLFSLWMLTLLIGCGAGALTGTTSSSGVKSSASPVVIAASQTQLRIGQTATLTATQGGVAVTGGTWQVVGGSSNGTIDGSGLYQTPTLVPSPNQISATYTVGGSVYPITLTLLNPLPVLLGPSPTALTALSTPMTFAGTGFTRGTVLNVNGTPIPTTYIDADHISATVTLPGGAAGSASITATNPDPGGSTSSALVVPIDLPTFVVSPAILSGGSVTLSISGGSFSGSPVVLMDGKELSTTLTSASTLSATGYLAPWKTGTTTIAIAPASGTAPTMQVSVPIAPTAVPYDTASRFATQAAFGPRHDVIEHIQQIGLSAFITEQMQQPGLPYNFAPCCGPRLTFIQNATSGNSLLRARVSWALQSFIVASQTTTDLYAIIPWQQKMEADAFGNFSQVLMDAASDTSMGIFLNTIGNVASTDPNIHPNQNFARELLQLFSLGDVMLNDDGTVQLDSSGTPIASYDQATIIDLSRVFTGWNCDQTPDPLLAPYGCNYAFPLVATESLHDHGQKVLFGTTILPAGQDAATDRTMALNAVFNHPNVPPYVSRILIQRLVKSSPSSAYVSRISAVFKDDGTGVRGNLAAVVRAILLDPEARAGDTTPSASDGYLQEPLLWETFGMSLLGMVSTDGEPTYVPGELGEDFDYAPTVFGFYSPTYDIPGTTINSPEFMLLNNLSMIQRSQLWWGMIQGSVQGFDRQPNYLYNTFTNVPDMVDALRNLCAGL